MVIPLVTSTIFIGCVLFAFWFGKPTKDAHGKWYFYFNTILLFLIGVISVVFYSLTSSTLAAWILLIFLFAITLIVEAPLTFAKQLPIAWMIRTFLAIFTGLICIVWNQIETRFSEEEFFTAIQFIILSGMWILIYFLTKFIPVSKSEKGYRFPIKIILPILILSFLCVIVIGIKSYQNSFFPMNVDTYHGVSESQPFLCGKIEQDSSIYLPTDVYEDYIKRIQLNPNKSTPDYGFLALATDNIAWYKKFKQLLMAEAEEGQFTKPSNSIKYTQYLASLRVYFYQKIIEQKPDLFSLQEQQEITTWFQKVNQRAQQIEWVDWLYAIAFSKLPEGPYENQDIGSGLLSLLEYYQFSDPNLAMTNQQYLQESLRGWFIRFRNIDDAFFYQSEWMDNALFQSTYAGMPPLENISQSKKWLLLQSPPDGYPLKYNQPSPADIAGSMLQSMNPEIDPTNIWLAGRVLEYSLKNDVFFPARPGVTAPKETNAESPEDGSCLIFGDSGLPNQQGPLAPDKIVFRDGWSTNSKFLALNLRFTGWHRYKATNSIILYYHQTPIIIEQTEGALFQWLPEGRSLFRDKRIPRENLNGLIVERVGLDYVLSILTGIGSQWAQDPPFYTQVDEFSNHEGFDYSRTSIPDWNGWFHQREIYFYHHGPTIIIDQAKSSVHHRAGIVWNFLGAPKISENDLIFEQQGLSSKISFITLGDETIKGDPYEQSSGESASRFFIQPSGSQNIFLITVIFDPSQMNANISTSTLGEITTVRIQTEGSTFEFPVKKLQ